MPGSASGARAPGAPGTDSGSGAVSAAAAAAAEAARAAGNAPGAAGGANGAPPTGPLTPNDFQRFVAASTGKALPLFGYELFQGGPSTFAPTESVPVPADYVIGPGDTLVIRATGMLDFELRPTVDREGQIQIPRVGPISVMGIKRSELEAHLTKQLSRSYRNFSLSVTMGPLRTIDVYVVGQARRPGKYTVSSLSTLVNALFASGGPNANGSMRRVQLVRGNAPVVTLDLYDFILRGDKSRDMRLLPGDVIVFPAAGPRVAVLGSVNTPAVFELAGPEASVSQVMALAGGMPVLATPLKVQLERINPAERVARQVESFALDAPGQARRLRDGDMLTVFPISPEFANAVTLRGNVASPLRYPFRPGMRVRDLIPEREALITPDYYVRKNLLVQFDDGGRGVGVEATRRDVLNRLDEVNWDYAVIERMDEREVRTQLMPFHLGRAVLEKDDAHNLELKPGDVVTIFGKKDLRVPQQRQMRLVRVEGEVAAPGIYALLPNETLPQLIARIGGLTGEAYVYGTELLRESVRAQQAQNLQQVVRRLEDQLAAGIAQRQANVTAVDPAQIALQQQRVAIEERMARERLTRLRQLQPTGRIALELDAGQPALPAVALEDNDRIVVPPRPSFVAVSGSVNNDNVLIWRSGRTVQEYLRVAGPTEGADLEQVFILRADGSVTSAPRRTGWLGWATLGGGSIENAVLQPGDTVVVPERVDRETGYTAFMRGLKDWTQIIYQLGLGAAAVKVLSN